MKRSHFFAEGDAQAARRLFPFAVALLLTARSVTAAPLLALNDATQFHVTDAGLPAYPLPDIICYGDSLTAGGYVTALTNLVGPSRTILTYGVGGETSPEILARIVGAVKVYPVGNESWSNGQVLTLRANIAEPPRLTQTNYASSWQSIYRTIERVTNLQFVANGHVLAATTTQQTVAVTTAYGTDAFRLNAPAHGLLAGTRLHFAPAAAMPPALSPWRFYYVVQAGSDSFAVAEKVNGAAIDLGGNAGAGLTVSGDFVASVVYDGSYTAADVTLRTRTEHEQWTTITWMGNNNYYQTAQIQSDLDRAINQQSPANRRTLHLGIVNGDWPERWNSGAHYAYFTNYNAWLSATWPASMIDIRTFLVTNYNPAVPQDLIDFGHDTLPSSLRVDNIHFNSKGNNLIAGKVKQWLDILPPNTLEIWNAGDGTLSYSSSSDAAWLRLVDGSGTSTGPTQRRAIYLVMESAALPVGVHTGRVTVTAAGAAGSPRTVTVVLTVRGDLPPPPLAVNSLPFVETFEAYAPGTLLDGVNGWRASEPTAVQASADPAILAEIAAYGALHRYPVATTHALAGAIDAPSALDVAGPSNGVVTVKMLTRLLPLEPAELPSPASLTQQLAVALGSDGNLRLFHGDPLSGDRCWSRFDTLLVDSSVWHTVTLEIDYASGGPGPRFFRLQLDEGAWLTHSAGYSRNDGTGIAGGTWFALADATARRISGLDLLGRMQLDDLLVGASWDTVGGAGDADGDGQWDLWEVRCFGATNAPAGAPTDDPDDDRSDNLTEFGADTDPGDAASRLAIQELTLGPGGARILWQGGRDATQVLEQRSNLTAGAWQPLATNLPPTASPSEAWDSASATPRFYRIRAFREAASGAAP